MGDELIHKRGECLREWRRGVQGGITYNVLASFLWCYDLVFYLSY
jgi:hypothetical protein